MKFLLIYILLGITIQVTAKETNLVLAKSKHITTVLNKGNEGVGITKPPKELFELIKYKSPVGLLPAFISKPKDINKKYPAIIWLVGGMSNSLPEVGWLDMSSDNDQTGSIFRKKGIVTMYVSYRGGNNNPGNKESFYGEVNDVVSAAKHLSKISYVDPERIYLGGHSTGATMALLVAESTNIFRSVFALGATSQAVLYGQESLNYDANNKTENKFRAPIEWLHTITSPTFIFEGSEGNIFSLFEMQAKNKNSKVEFYPIYGFGHFNLIFPLSNIIADKIINDTGKATIDFDKDKLIAKLKEK